MNQYYRNVKWKIMRLIKRGCLYELDVKLCQEKHGMKRAYIYLFK